MLPVLGPLLLHPRGVSEAQKMHVVHVADFHESWLVQVWPDTAVRKKHRECEPENCKL